MKRLRARNAQMFPVVIAAMHRSEVSVLPNLRRWQSIHPADPITGRAPDEGGGEWDKTSEVPEVHGASRWWALSKAVKPLFSKQFWRGPAQFRAPAAWMPAPRSAT